MSIKKIAVSSAVVVALASKGEAKVKLTKQQAISLKLAQWLGRAEAIKARNDIRYAMTFAAGEFNPFADTTEGRAQFAECVIKADRDGIMCLSYIGEARLRGANLVEARLEAIYYAIGGTVEAKPS